jgi:lipopolysaccharide/colanic/teichoic acid biosynthesis glycosyltransferase
MMPSDKSRRGILVRNEVLLSILGLAALSPILLLAGVLIRIGSPGPVLFCQRRVGRNGKLFTLYKLRTMCVSQGGPLVTAAGDARVTRIGKFLRKTKIDELPALWNVVRGDMSFVGPRPEVPDLVDLHDPRWQEILRSRPGLTDPVTLRLRNEESLLAKVVDKERFYSEILQPYKLNGYLLYVRKKNWKTDCKIIAETLKAVVLPHTTAMPTLDEMVSSFSEA